MCSLNALYKTLRPDTLYEVPLMLHCEGLDRVVCKRLGLPDNQPDLSEWQSMVKRLKPAARCNNRACRQIRCAEGRVFKRCGRRSIMPA
jgi:CTP synthase (UTP-ammonia lyase)